LTFVATANAVRYVGARPVFVDSERRSWNVDPALLESELCRRASEGRLPAAVIAVDLYGQCADYTRVAQLCADHRVPLIEDAAEALGATCGSRPAGSFGTAAVLSFNGNKIVTTSSGGMLLTDDEVVARRTLHLATQAREPAAHYEHAELGFNYRMSNLLAAVGRAQLRSLPERQQRRGAVDDRYRAALGDVAGVEFLPRAPWGTSNHWLTCLTIDPGVAGAHRDDVIAALGDHDVEARPTWKPMHRQPLYRDAPAVLTGVADEIFDSGLCLPSGARLSEGDQGRIIDVVCATLAA